MNSTKQQSIFDAWLREHAAILHHVANGFATGADRHDLMQELMLALWRAVPAFRGASLPSTFIFRVTHNAALTWKRAERSYRRRIDSFQEQHAVFAERIEPHGGDPATDTLELLYGAIRTLDPLDRSLVLLAARRCELRADRGDPRPLGIQRRRPPQPSQTQTHRHVAGEDIMTFEDLAPVWRSSRNQPDPAQVESYKANIVSRLSKEYRDFLWHVGFTSAMTIFLAGGFVQYVRSGGAFDLQREWASIVFLLMPLGIAAAFLRGFIRHRQQHPRYDLSIKDGLRALLDQNRLSRARLRMSMIVLTVAMALLPVITYQLQLVGKQRPHEAASMLAVFGVAYVISMGAQIWRYRRKLRPENARLQELLGSYG